MTSKISFKLLFLTLHLFHCCPVEVKTTGIDHAGINIVGGREATAHHHPFIVSLRMNFLGHSFHTCGGTIVKEDWVLTAAHCLQSHNLPEGVHYEVVGGDHNLNMIEETEQVRRVGEIIIHEHYNSSSSENDIALLKLNSSLLFNPYVSNLNLAPAGYKTSGEVEAIGWGALESGGGPSETLQEVTVQVIDDDTCRLSYGNHTITDSMLCAGDESGGRDSCQGDSGGPLVKKTENGTLYLVGITSWGYGCAHPNFPGVYTEVSYFSDWVTQHISDVMD